MDIVKCNKFNVLKNEVYKFGQQSKNLNCESRRLEHKVETLKDPNDVCECIIALNSFSISKMKIDQVVSMVLSKLTKTDIERF